MKSQKNVSFLKIASEASFKMYQNSNLNFSVKNIFFWRNFFIFLFWLWDIFLNFQIIVEESLQDYAKMVWRVAKKCRISRIRLLSYEIKSAERWEVFLFFVPPLSLSNYARNTHSGWKSHFKVSYLTILQILHTVSKVIFLSKNSEFWRNLANHLIWIFAPKFNNILEF